MACCSATGLEVNVQHDRNPVFIKLSDGSIRNGYTIKLLNMIPEPRVISLRSTACKGADMTIAEMPEVKGAFVEHSGRA